MKRAGEVRLEYRKSTIFKPGAQHEATRNPASTASCNNALAGNLKREQYKLQTKSHPAYVGEGNLTVDCLSPPRTDWRAFLYHSLVCAIFDPMHAFLAVERVFQSCELCLKMGDGA